MNARGVVNLREKLSGFSEHWSPRTIGSYNGNDVMVVRVEGEFIWHSHAETDDLFLVIDGELDIEMRDRTVSLRAGELFVVPRGVEHRPVARRGEAQVMIMEPAGTPNTGNPDTAARRIEI